MPGGVFAATNSANHDETSYPGTNSAIAGRSGTSGCRFAVVTASPRSCPFCTYGKVEGKFAKIASTRPGMRSFSAGPAPRYGMCVTSIPAMRLNSSPARCSEVPMPDEQYVTLPGSALARAMNSGTDLDGDEFGTAKMLG